VFKKPIYKALKLIKFAKLEAVHARFGLPIRSK